MLELSYFPAIDLKATGLNILKLRLKSGYSVKELRDCFGFDTPQSIYKWQQGKNLPSVDNLLVLSILFDTTINDILICDSTVNMAHISDEHRGQSDAHSFYFILLR